MISMHVCIFIHQIWCKTRQAEGTISKGETHLQCNSILLLITTRNYTLVQYHLALVGFGENIATPSAARTLLSALKLRFSFSIPSQNTTDPPLLKGTLSRTGCFVAAVALTLLLALSSDDRLGWSQMTGLPRSRRRFLLGGGGDDARRVGRGGGRVGAGGGRCDVRLHC